MTENTWLRLDEIENAIDNLETCGFLLEGRSDPIRWKWGIIALHQALYGFAVCAIRGSDSTSVLVKPKDPNSNLISMWEALKRARDSRYIWSGFTPLTISDVEWNAVERISSEFRNGFEHFRPMGWSIEVSGMPDLFECVLRVIERLAIECGGVRYDDEGGIGRVARAAATIRRSVVRAA